MRWLFKWQFIIWHKRHFTLFCHGKIWICQLIVWMIELMQKGIPVTYAIVIKSINEFNVVCSMKIYTQIHSYYKLNRAHNPLKTITWQAENVNGENYPLNRLKINSPLEHRTSWTVLHCSTFGVCVFDAAHLWVDIFTFPEFSGKFPHKF